MRRTLTALAAPLLIVALAACGAKESPEDPTAAPTVETTQEEAGGPPDGGAAAESEAPTEESTKDEESPDDDASEGPTYEAPNHAATSIEQLWVDDSWTLEEVEEDLCEMGMSESIYSEQDGMFTCGPTAASALACALEDGESVICITNPLGKTAISFLSPAAADPSTERWPSEMKPVPLTVELDNGAVCSSISHDHDQHWNDVSSWFRCDDGSELLTPEYIDGTFERGKPWIAHRSVDQGEPEATMVKTATFAGR